MDSLFLHYNIENELSQANFIKTKNNLQTKKQEQNKVISILINALRETKHHTDEKEKRLIDCGTFITISPTSGRITSANFCKNKLCPICQWRKSLKVYGEILQIQKRVEETTKDFIFFTLTLENTKDLEKGINEILKGFYNFSNDRTFKKISKGYIRTLEITYNEKRETWHPHIHLIVALKENYFIQNYKEQKEWAKIWERCAKKEYTPIIDVRKVKQDKDEETYKKAIAEISKYSVKPFATKKDKSQEYAYKSIIKETHHRRLRSYGGIYAKIKKELNFNDGEEPESIAKETDKVFRFQKNKYIEIEHIKGEWIEKS